MAFLLSLLYIALALLSPADMFPSVATYRIELVVILLTLLFTAPSLLDFRFFQIPQVYLLAGLCVAIFLSVAIGENWVGGGFTALQIFLPAGIVFYLVVLNCQSIRKLEFLSWMLIIVAIYYILAGASAYLSEDRASFEYKSGCAEQDIARKKGAPGVPAATLQECSPLVKVFPVDNGVVILRMRGLGFLHDPNDLAQFLVMLLPFIWLRWRDGFRLRNAALVIVPTAFFIWGIYLTHSRGAILALVVILILALKDRISLPTAVIAGGLTFAALLALDFAGGRDISIQAGAGRLALWGDGLQLFKESPLFGVGFEGFAQQAIGHTAHNSFIVCLAELGLFGYLFWVALFAFTISGLNSLIKWCEQGRLRTVKTPAQHLEDDDDSGRAEISKWAKAMRLSIAGFLAGAWFLSRAHVPTLYLALGMAVAVLLIAKRGEDSIPRKPIWHLFGQTATWGFAALLLVYLSLRIRSFFGA